tara:strand:+ start:6910 stop:7185 length:276 start_codon:yes stop_codon:yes gene_type:complete
LQWIKAKVVPYNLAFIFQQLKNLPPHNRQNNGKALPLIGKNPARAIRLYPDLSSRDILEIYPYRLAQALQSLPYRQIFDVSDGYARIDSLK